jgi:hypothetical protein
MKQTKIFTSLLSLPSSSDPVKMSLSAHRNHNSKNLMMSTAVIVTVVLLFMTSTVSSLRCYQCYSNSLEPCPYEDFRECPRFSFYNRCSIKVRRVITGETFVKRECSLGCEGGSDAFSDREIRLRDHCDTSRPDHECKICCRGDGCNYSSGSNVVPNLLVVSLVLVFVKFGSSFIHAFHAWSSLRRWNKWLASQITSFNQERRRILETEKDQQQNKVHQTFFSFPSFLAIIFKCSARNNSMLMLYSPFRVL